MTLKGLFMLIYKKRDTGKNYPFLLHNKNYIYFFRL